MNTKKVLRGLNAKNKDFEKYIDFFINEAREAKERFNSFGLQAICAGIAAIISLIVSPWFSMNLAFLTNVSAELLTILLFLYSFVFVFLFWITKMAFNFIFDSLFAGKIVAKNQVMFYINLRKLKLAKLEKVGWNIVVEIDHMAGTCALVDVFYKN